MSKTLPIIAFALTTACAPPPSGTDFRSYAPATQALPVGLSTTVPVPWTDFITPNVTFEVQPDQVYEIWVKPGHASILNFPNDEFITSKSVSDPAHWFLSQAQPNHYTPTDHRLAVLASDANKSAMLEVFTQTRHYRIRLKSIDGTAFNQTVDWQLPALPVQVASAAPFLPSDVPSLEEISRGEGHPQDLLSQQFDSDDLANTQAFQQSPQEPVKAPELVEIALEEWSVREGQTLGDVLNDWTVRAGYRLLAMPEQTWRLGVSDNFSGEFEDALDWLLSGFAHAASRPVAIVHSNRVIEIKEDLK